MPRGRPRKFDEEAALKGAMLLFWEKGLSATSLDDLAQAMNMNRPSIYNAFGNKDEIYRKALDKFCGQLDHGLETALEAIPSLHKGLEAFFDQALEVYCGTHPAMGCLMICTAPSEALSHPEVGEDLRGLISRLDNAFTQRLRRAQKEGEISKDVQPELTASLLQATLQTLALRARAGTSKQELKKIAGYAVKRLIE
ncbi:TetR/AcrR family transcriptional regulator [Pseudoteredinibacter isoporae]|uniref:TetR/AcrR family transcriptional regulator n=1 Tax=Pseudoteredinibacter isoporae TaxID=570281 RepID=UPI003109FA91